MAVWLQGLIVAVISGAVSALGGILISPETIDFTGPGLRKMLLLAAGGALIGVVGFLKQSPIPTTSKTTETKTTTTEASSPSPDPPVAPKV
jgi:hypothetical protein